MKGQRKTPLPPTNNELLVLGFIEGYQDKNEYAPLQVEIAAKLGCTQQRINAVLQSLENKGLIKIYKYKRRGIKLTKKYARSK